MLKTMIMNFITKQSLTRRPIYYSIIGTNIKNMSSDKRYGISLDSELNLDALVNGLPSQLHEKTYLFHSIKQAKSN